MTCLRATRSVSSTNALYAVHMRVMQCVACVERHHMTTCLTLSCGRPDRIDGEANFWQDVTHALRLTSNQLCNI